MREFPLFWRTREIHVIQGNSFVIHVLESLVRASQLAQLVKNPPAIQETQVWSLGREDPLKKETATHSSISAWEIPWTEQPAGQQSTGSQKSQTHFSNERTTKKPYKSPVWIYKIECIFYFKIWLVFIVTYIMKIISLHNFIVHIIFLHYPKI